MPPAAPGECVADIGQGIQVFVVFNEFIVQDLILDEDVLGFQAAGKGVELGQALFKYLGLYKIAVPMGLDDVAVPVQLFQRRPYGRPAHMINLA